MKSHIALGVIALVLMACGGSTKQQAGIDARVDSVLNLMTLEEKIGQLNLRYHQIVYHRLGREIGYRQENR